MADLVVEILVVAVLVVVGVLVSVERVVEVVLLDAVQGWKESKKLPF